jgi:hypothetical protein
MSALSLRKKPIDNAIQALSIASWNDIILERILYKKNGEIHFHFVLERVPEVIFVFDNKKVYIRQDLSKLAPLITKISLEEKIESRIRKLLQNAPELHIHRRLLRL